MTLTAAFFAELHQRGIELWTEGGKLRYKGSPGSVTADILTVLKANKAEILETLRTLASDTVCVVCGDTAPVFHEGRTFCERHVPTTPLLRALLQAIDLYAELYRQILVVTDQGKRYRAAGDHATAAVCSQHASEIREERYAPARQEVARLQKLVDAGEDELL